MDKIKLEKENLKKLGSIFLFSLIISLIIAPLRGGYLTIWNVTGVMLSAITGFVVYVAYTYWLFKKYSFQLKHFYIVLFILLGFSILTLPVRIFYFTSTLSSFPDYLIHILGVLTGYVLYIVRPKYKVIIGIFALLAALWLSIPGYKMWLHKLSFGTFTGKIKPETHSIPLIVQNTDGEKIDLSQFKGKYVLLDFWFSFCGGCYEKLPEVQEVYDTYKNASDILIYSIHCRMENGFHEHEPETIETGKNILQKEGFDIPVLSISMENTILKELGIHKYPTVLVLNPESKIIYRGNIKGASKLIKNIS